MSDKHTPGPWNWQGPISRNLANCLSGGGRPLLRCIDVSETDARLIAAAPDLLEALKAIVSIDTHSILTEAEADAIHQQARTAIAKATGETK